MRNWMWYNCLCSLHRYQISAVYTRQHYFTSHNWFFWWIFPHQNVTQAPITSAIWCNNNVTITSDILCSTCLSHTVYVFHPFSHSLFISIYFSLALSSLCHLPINRESWTYLSATQLNMHDWYICVFACVCVHVPFHWCHRVMDMRICRWSNWWLNIYIYIKTNNNIPECPLSINAHTNCPLFTAKMQTHAHILVYFTHTHISNLTVSIIQTSTKRKSRPNCHFARAQALNIVCVCAARSL